MSVKHSKMLKCISFDLASEAMSYDIVKILTLTENVVISFLF